jgi:hypothetical protein
MQERNVEKESTGAPHQKQSAEADQPGFHHIYTQGRFIANGFPLLLASG